MAKIARIVAEAVELEPSTAAGATSGVMQCGSGVCRPCRGNTSAAVFGTDPVRALLAKERRR
jgi:hypothetical protein